jgi:hypothetical protein
MTTTTACDVLSATDLAFFDTHGYVKFASGIAPEQLDRSIAAIFRNLEMDPEDAEDWYRPPLHPGGMVEICHHQALWDNRQHPALHAAFSAILGTHRLWVSMDRANFKPPSHPKHPEYDHHGFMHWDLKPEQLPRPLRVQGVLYLDDTPAETGGFQCVPGFHHVLEAWAQSDPDPARRGPVPDFRTEPAVPVEGKAGDFVIWDTRLPHGNGHNSSSQPRFAQFIRMQPARDDDEARAKRVRRIDEREAFEASRDPRRWEYHHLTPPVLSGLGRKLAGYDRWDD